MTIDRPLSPDTPIIQRFKASHNVASREAMRQGHGGVKKIAEITGVHHEIIRRGRDELQNDLADRPTDRIRCKGGGRPRVEKKIPRCSTTC